MWQGRGRYANTKFMRCHGALLVNLVNITEHFGPKVTGRA